jgi:ankyrin repeat protein
LPLWRIEQDVLSKPKPRLIAVARPNRQINNSRVRVAGNRRGDKDMAALLVTKGADVNAKNDAGLTPLDFAEQKGLSQIVELLRKHGARE